MQGVNFMKLKPFLLAGVSVMSGVSAVLPLSAQADDDESVKVELFAPAKGDHVGIGGRGWFIDLAIFFETSLETSGFTTNADGKPGFQLTGPNAPASANFTAGTHNNVNPFPGTFSLGADERLPGVIVLLSTTTVGVGSCHNVANLFNLTGVTNLSAEGVELWDTWLVGAPNFGVDTESQVYVAVAADLNGDGIYNDAPNVVPDANGDGKCDARDLRAFGVASNIKSAKFYINP
jgi:hypothetical protein